MLGKLNRIQSSILIIKMFKICIDIKYLKIIIKMKVCRVYISLILNNKYLSKLENSTGIKSEGYNFILRIL